MRIIDKNTDFYDYLQNMYRDNTITFDRTDSFVLTKEEFLRSYLWFYGHFGNEDNTYVLLQVCNTFWLFHVTFTKTGTNCFDEPTDYALELLISWKNYNKIRKLIKLDCIEFPFYFNVNKTTESLLQFVDNSEYRIRRTVDKHTIYRDDGNNVEKHIPILKACGIGPLINPLEMYLAIEEYFSLEKQDSERTESVGLTNNEKIENHGFDTKVSFRGKQ